MSFDTLAAAYADRLSPARAAHAAGIAVAGVWGAGAPIELMMATGHCPVAIAPMADRPMTHSRPFFLDTMAPQVDAGLDQLLSGELAFLRLAIFVSQGEEDFLLYNSAKEVLRLGEGGAMPPLHLHVMMGERHPAAIDYGIDQMRRLARRLSAASGIRATGERIAEAAAITNRVRAAGRALLAARAEGRVSGVAALQAIGAGRFLAAADYAPLLEAFVATLGEASAAPRLLVIGSEPMSDLSLHAAIEAAGARVIGEDDAWGSRAVSPDMVVEGDPIEALFHHYHRHTPARAIFPHDVRNAWLYDAARTPGLAGVIVHMPPSDRVLGWDFPRIRRTMAGLGLPVLALREDVSTDAGRSAAQSAVAAFLATLEPRA